MSSTRERLPERNDGSGGKCDSSSEVVEGSDTSDEGSPSDGGTGHDETATELDDKDEDITPTPVVAEADGDGEIQDLEYDCELYSKSRCFLADL